MANDMRLDTGAEAVALTGISELQVEQRIMYSYSARYTFKPHGMQM
jgi:hypothetical protein